MKKIVCDTSSLISISDNCLLPIFDRLGSNVQFIIPQKVKEELIDKPMRTKRFAYKAFVMRKFLEKDLIKIYDNPEITAYAKKITDLANSLLVYNNRPIFIMHEGEAQTLGCLKFLNEKTLLVDERTTRHLIEDVELLKKYMENITKYKVHVNPQVAEQLNEELKDIEVIRSAEILAYAYEKNIMERLDSSKVLEASLYALKFSGCSITNDEIREYVHMLG